MLVDASSFEECSLFIVEFLCDAVGAGSEVSLRVVNVKVQLSAMSCDIGSCAAHCCLSSGVYPTM